MSGNPIFTTLLDQVRRAATRAFAHADAPFAKVVEALRLPQSDSYAPLCQVLRDVAAITSTYLACSAAPISPNQSSLLDVLI